MNLLPRFVTHNASLKLLAFVLAVFLWAIVPGAPQAGETLTDVPVRVQVADPDWVQAAPPEPAEVQVRLSGPTREIVQLAREGTTIRVTVDRISSPDTTVALRRDWVALTGAPGVIVEEVAPGAIRLQLEPAKSGALPFEIRTRGALPAGMALAAPLAATPPLARVRGPTRLVDELETIPLLLLNLGGIDESGIFDLPVDTSGLGSVLVTPQRASVSVQVEPAVERTRVGVPVEVADGPDYNLLLEPDTTEIRIFGASGRLAVANLAGIRAVVDGRLLQEMEPGQSRRVPLGLREVPFLLTAVAGADSVTVIRPLGERGMR
ncbi:MAG: hypothetical protein JSU98_07750 [Gemmatimonadales bacterium]|nr:MAG: hypothetical protein JSU98_07750 [Gemmatimonadales bacterium]